MSLARGAPGACFLLGPTASGKTALALDLAERLGAEILCLDSMQLYRGYPVASAQPSEEERRRVPHHLFEILSLEEDFDTGRFVKRSLGVVREIRERGRLPLFVGGTVLYYKALVEGLADLPPRNPTLRRELRASWEADDGAALWAELERVDPRRARDIGRRDYRRIERALEVHRLTGTSLSELHERPRVVPLENLGTVALRPSREWIRARVAARQQLMLDQGLVEEMHQLWERFRGREPLPTSLQAIGARDFMAHFEGELALGEALDRMLHATQRLVRHQDTWLRKTRGPVGLDPAQLSRDELLEHSLEVLGEPGRGGDQSGRD